MRFECDVLQYFYHSVLINIVFDGFQRVGSQVCMVLFLCVQCNEDSALTHVVEQNERHLSLTNPAPIVPSGFGEPDPTWVSSRKVVLLNKNKWISVIGSISNSTVCLENKY